MYNFSEEELIELAKYPTKALEHANKQMTNMLHEGKPISSPFKWMLVVCDRWIEDQSKTPQKGKTGSYGKTVSASQDRQARDSMRERYTSQVDGITQKKHQQLRLMGIDPEGLSPYQIKLALEGKPYSVDYMLKDIEAGPFHSVAVFKELMSKKF